MSNTKWFVWLHSVGQSGSTISEAPLKGAPGFRGCGWHKVGAARPDVDVD